MLQKVVTAFQKLRHGSYTVLGPNGTYEEMKTEKFQPTKYERQDLTPESLREFAKERPPFYPAGIKIRVAYLQRQLPWQTVDGWDDKSIDDVWSILNDLPDTPDYVKATKYTGLCKDVIRVEAGFKDKIEETMIPSCQIDLISEWSEI